LRKARNRASLRAVLGRAFQSLVRSAFALLLAAGFGLVASRAAAEEEAVRVAYAAPDSCPDEQVFVSRVRARTQHGRFAEPGELARTFDVSLTESAGDAGFAGQIEFVDVDGQSARRSVAGATCDEVASSLALIMALSIDDRVALAGTRDNPSLPSAPLAALSEPPKKATPSPAASPSAPRTTVAPAALHLRWDVGANAGVLTWVAPQPAFVFGAFVALGSREHAWNARLSVFDARQTTDVRVAQQAHFAIDWLRLELCPLTLPLAAHISISPCAAFDGGALNGTASGDALSPNKNQPLFWAAGVALLRLSWEVQGRLILGLDGELAAPLIRHDFRIQNPDATFTSVFQVPSLGVGAKAGAAVRFP
jgi:hypothetical protein